MELSTAINQASKIVDMQVCGDGAAGVSISWIYDEVEITPPQALEIVIASIDAKRVIFDSHTDIFYEKYGKRVRQIAFLKNDILYLSLYK
jgi:hypothetical protein